MAELILEELRGLFRDDVSDPALGGVWITSLVLSVDYRHARVHFVVHGDVDRRLLEERLKRVIPFLRSRLGEAIDLKRVPDLAFVLDATAPRGEV